VISVDAYESRRQNAIGRLCRGNADALADRDVNDMLAIRNEILQLGNPFLANGNPDCDENGGVDINDALCVRTLVQNGNGACANGL
jgi:hypothetical protein